MWCDSTSLYEMQQDIAKLFERKMRLHIKVCDIIDLPYNEYICLINKVKQIRTAEQIDHFSLSILVAWVTSYKFKHQDEFYKVIKEVVNTMPQHHTKYVLEAINTTCYDYQIDLFDHYVASLSEIREITKIHAGY